MPIELDANDTEIIREVLYNNFTTFNQQEMIFDNGMFFVGNKRLFNSLGSFVTSYQLSELRKRFTDELLIGRIVEYLNQ